MAGRLNMAIRKLNKHFTNPLLMHWAGRGSFYAGVIHHVGRKSGRRYATPVYPEPVQGGFVIPLPYGDDTDWLKNVLAAGKGQLDIGEERVLFDNSRVVAPSVVAPLLPPKVARRFSRYRWVLFIRRETAARAA